MTIRIIAEAGENHLGDVNRALEMVRLAAASGADFIKFQSYSEEDLSPDIPEETRAWIRRTQLSVDNHYRLRDEAEKKGITFLSTAVNIKWAKLLFEIGCRAVKVASLSLTNYALLRFIGECFDEVFISTGMGDVEEIERAVDAVRQRARVTLLHCVSEYPTPDIRASLHGIPYLRQRFDCSVGYSDHTIGAVACIAACALGAELIEKHFTLDKTLEGTDHILSADPIEFCELVYNCRRVTVQLGSNEKRPTPIEMKNRQGMRSLFREV